MKAEEKQLLLKDLCSRLPYNVIVEYGVKYEGRDLGEKKGKLTGRMLDSYFYNITVGLSDVYSIKPYLRPMSSMTEEEKKELKEVLSPQGTAIYECNGISIPLSHFGEFVPYEYMGRVICWLNAHHFDYSGLIEKGLALEALEDMYND